MRVFHTKRKMAKKLFAGVLAFSMAAGTLPAGAQETEQDTDKVSMLVESMTVREKIGQMFMPAVRSWVDAGAEESEGEQAAVAAGTASAAETVPMTELREEVRKAISEDRLGGFILYSENCQAGNRQTLELVNELQEANKDTDSECVIPLLIATDQEGGIVTRLSQGAKGVGSMALTASGDTANIAEEASVIGRELTSVGINTTFAPDVDVNNNPANPVIGVRSFSDLPEVVSEAGNIFMKAMSEEGVITSLKHFPGHGDTDTDSHSGLPLVDKSYEELKQFELIPFQSAIDNGAEMIMTAHIQYPQIETGTCKSISTGEDIYLPATLSKTILTDILRGDMGFEGVVVSDSLSMDAIKEHFDLADACRRSIEAGVDLILVPIMAMNLEDVQNTEALMDQMAELVEQGEIPQERIDEAVTRILTLKEKHGLLDEIDTELTQERLDAAGDEQMLEEDIAVQWEHAKKAVTLVKNEDAALPISMGEDEKVLFLFNSSLRPYYADKVMEALKESGTIPQSAQYESIVTAEDTEQDCIEKAAEADYLFVISSVFSSSGFDPTAESGLSGKIFDEAIDASHEAGHKVVFVSGMLPYDAARYQSADAILLTYGSSGITDPSDKLAAYVPNLEAGMRCAFGEFEPTGTLPVTIPSVGDDWLFTDEVLYERGTSLGFSD